MFRFCIDQSYGGFLTLHYLSAAPDSLRRCFVTGGLASVTRPPTDNYTSTNKTVLARNAQYYRKYPEDIKRVRDIVKVLKMMNFLLKMMNFALKMTVRDIVEVLADTDNGAGVALPGGGRLSVR